MDRDFTAEALHQIAVQMNDIMAGISQVADRRVNQIEKDPVSLFVLSVELKTNYYDRKIFIVVLTEGQAPRRRTAGRISSFKNSREITGSLSSLQGYITDESELECTAFFFWGAGFVRQKDRAVNQIIPITGHTMKYAGLAESLPRPSQPSPCRPREPRLSMSAPRQAGSPMCC